MQYIRGCRQYHGYKNNQALRFVHKQLRAQVVCILVSSVAAIVRTRSINQIVQGQQFTDTIDREYIRNDSKLNRSRDQPLFLKYRNVHVLLKDAQEYVQYDIVMMEHVVAMKEHVVASIARAPVYTVSLFIDYQAATEAVLHPDTCSSVDHIPSDYLLISIFRKCPPPVSTQPCAIHASNRREFSPVDCIASIWQASGKRLTGFASNFRRQST